jgi:hypothetical protein
MPCSLPKVKPNDISFNLKTIHNTIAAEHPMRIEGI